MRIFILIRKLNTLRVKRDIQIKKVKSSSLYVKSPLETVLEILNGIRDKIDAGELKVIADLNHCIKLISSNKLYDADFTQQ